MSLKTGDYSLHGYHKYVAVERKSWADYFNCCIGPASKQLNFMRQLERLSSLTFGVVIVEGVLSRCFSGFARGDKHDMNRLVAQTAIIIAEHSVPILFAENRGIAQSLALEWLEAVNERIRNQWNDIHTPIYKRTSPVKERTTIDAMKAYHPKRRKQSS